MQSELERAIYEHHHAFKIDPSETVVKRLNEYYELVQTHNPLLHLVAPCSAEEFAIRHILESLTLLDHLPRNARFADVGAGAGLPSIPSLIAREDLHATLIESKEKKAEFLRETVQTLGLGDRVNVIGRQFAEVENRSDVVTCRAIDKFVDVLPRLLKWSRHCNLLLFGGKNLADALRKNDIEPREVLMPLSEQRYLFVIDRSRRD